MNDDSANNDDVNRPDWLGIVPVALPVFIVGLLLWLIFKR